VVTIIPTSHPLSSILNKITEGYLEKERVLYKGGFKLGEYHSHGTLYWSGTDVIEYTGRFKMGVKNGRGVQFDQAGRKVRCEF
jgi:hypothetical protein